VLEYASPGSPESEEIVEEYLEVLEPGEFPKLLAADTSDIAPAQGKPRCIYNPYFGCIYIYIIYMCVLCIYVAGMI
jgi:hypothetical protein